MSLTFHHDYPLKDLNTFGIESYADCYVRLESRNDITELHHYLQAHGLPLLLIGGGSNLVLDERVPGIVARVALEREEVEELGGDPVGDDRVRVTLGAGKNWHRSIEHLLAQGIFGLENLALIPGCVGAAPVQNIGAYGVEVRDRIEAVEVYDWRQKSFYWIDNVDCGFGYRDSLFKRDYDRYLITAVRFLLSRTARPVLTYKPLKEVVECGRENDPRAIFDAVCRIRRSKLPDPAKLGNAGSFFKNPIVSARHHADLKRKYPDLVAYLEGDRYKLAAGWLIDSLGWKGHRQGQVGVHEHQALVLVNYGGGNRRQIEALAGKISADVRHHFGVQLEVEPRYYP